MFLKFFVCLSRKFILFDIVAGGVGRCKQDEKLLAAILGEDKRGYIIDTRSASVTNHAKVTFIQVHIYLSESF